MAATERGAGNAGTTLLALTSAALALPGIGNAALPAADAHGTVQYGEYRESADRMRARIYHADAVLPLSERTEFTVSLDQDTYSGATPLFSLPSAMRNQPKQPLGLPNYVPTDVVATASPVVGTFELTAPLEKFRSFQLAQIAHFIAHPGDIAGGFIAGYRALFEQLVPDGDPVSQVMTLHPEESRAMPVIGWNRYFDDLSLSLSGGRSDEPDFKSSFGNIKLGWELNQKLTTLDLGYGFTLNDISRAVSHGSGGAHVHGGDLDYPALDEHSRYDSLTVGLSQVLSRNSLVQLNLGHTRQRGYLSNPYKLVYVRGEITPEEYWDLRSQQKVFQDVTDLEVMGPELFREVRPDHRDQWTVSARLRQHVPAADATVHLDYRYYRDDWGIDAHTLEAAWHQSLPDGLSLVPRLRYYTQTAADFFAPYFLAPRADGLYSSDYRLSGYGALSLGLDLSKRFERGFSLQAGIEYYVHRGGLQAGGGAADYADYHSYLAHATLSLDLSGRNSGDDHAAHHHAHADHGAPLPAGVMFGHMLSQPGDLMIGYDLMYADQAGDMHHGTRRATDAELIANACGGAACTSRPAQMTMYMHMLHLMYAPSDWLNLVVMPTLVNMEMEMAPLVGAAADDTHAHPHNSDGPGDTLLGALLRLYQAPGRHLHLGLGLSAPTGSLDATLDGTQSDTSLRQSYGMQRGSGTWDFKPSLTYTGQDARWNWGAQLSAILRLEDSNELGYALGDQWQATAWGGYALAPGLFLSARGLYTEREPIDGYSRAPNSAVTPPDNRANYGGQFWDLGLGLALAPAGGPFNGHRVSLEWLEPLRHDYNGYQFEGEGMLHAGWSYHF